MNCSTHPKKPAVAKCDNCGAPICETCYDAFELPDNEGHLCANCYKEELRSDAAEAEALKGMVKKEFIFIIIGLIVGLALGIYCLVNYGSPFGVIAIIFLPFIMGSLITIIKKIKNQYSEERDESDDGGSNFLTLIFIILLNILGSPITTIVRFVQRVGDMRTLNRIYSQNIQAISAIDEFITRTLQPSAVATAAEGGGDVEISLDSILASGLGSDAALCDNGEILRTIRTR